MFNAITMHWNRSQSLPIRQPLERTIEVGRRHTTLQIQHMETAKNVHGRSSLGSDWGGRPPAHFEQLDIRILSTHATAKVDAHAMDAIHCDDHKVRVPRNFHRAKLTPMAQLNAKSKLLESCAMKLCILPFLVGYQRCNFVNGLSLTSSTCSGLS